MVGFLVRLIPTGDDMDTIKLRVCKCCGDTWEDCECLTWCDCGSTRCELHCTLCAGSLTGMNDDNYKGEESNG